LFLGNQSNDVGHAPRDSDIRAIVDPPS